METFSDIILFIENHFVNEIFICVFFLVVVRAVFKKIDISLPHQIIKWILIAYGLLFTLNILYWFIFTHNSHSVFSQRIEGPYKYAYWLMIAGNCLPLLLLIKKIGNNIYFILLTTFCMNWGWLVESTLMHITSNHSDPTELERYMRYLPYERELVIILTGVIYGIVLLLIGYFIKAYRTPTIVE